MWMQSNRVLVGAMLILIGVLALVQNFDLLPIEGEHVFGSICFIGGTMVFALGRQERHAFKFYGGLALMFVGFATLADATGLVPGGAVGAVFLWTVAGLLLRVYLNRRERYWAVIPAGVLFTLGAMACLEGYHVIHGESTGALFFLGIAATFGYLYIVRNERNKLDWAKYPATATLALSVLVYFSDRHYDAGPVIFATLFILAGLALIVKTLREGHQQVSPNDQTA
jgi:hypothetical protein